MCLWWPDTLSKKRYWNYVLDETAKHNVFFCQMSPKYDLLCRCDKQIKIALYIQKVLIYTVQKFQCHQKATLKLTGICPSSKTFEPQLSRVFNSDELKPISNTEHSAY